MVIVNEGLNFLILLLNFMRIVVEFNVKFYDRYFIFYSFFRFLKNVENRLNCIIYGVLEGLLNMVLKVCYGYYIE